MDRLSQLPDHLIVVILSLLPLHEAIRTSVLSKQWRNLWTQVSAIDLSDNKINYDRGLSSIEITNNFKNFVNKLLLEPFSYRDPSYTIEKLKFNFVEGAPHTAYSNCVDLWVKAALSRGLTELHINSSSVLLSSTIDCVFTAHNLRYLRLGNLYHLNVMDHPKIFLPSLTVLSLDIIYSDFNTMEQILSPNNFPKLKILNLTVNFSSFYNSSHVFYPCIRITSPTLKQLDFVVNKDHYSHHSVVLDTPVLRRLRIFDCFVKCIHSKPMRDLRMVSTNICFPYQIPFVNNHSLHIFSSVENLELTIDHESSISNVLFYLKYLPRLSKLIVHRDEDLNPMFLNYSEYKITTTLPYLKWVEFDNFVGTVKEMSLLKVIASRATSITKLVIKFRSIIQPIIQPREKYIQSRIENLPWSLRCGFKIIFE